MTKFKLVCNGFWPDGEIDNGQKFFDANFDIVNIETGETVGETGRCGWDEANLRALDGASCNEEGELIETPSLSVFLVKLKDPSCGNEVSCTVISTNRKRAIDVAISEVQNGFIEVVSIRSFPTNEERFCWDFCPAMDGY